MSCPSVGSRRRRTVARRVGSCPEPSEGESPPTYLGEVPADSRKRAVAHDVFWDAFEPDVFGGPEAEPQPEYGDFFYEPDDVERVWE